MAPTRRTWRQKLTNFAPHRPARRYNIFCGSNSWSEWWFALRMLLSPNVTSDEAVIAEYERQFARLTGTREAVSFAAGRVALYAILEALEIGEGDEVIIPAFTCVVVPNAIIYRGARPVYVDITTDTFNIDPARIEAAITPRTRALYAQHTFGIPCDVAELRRIAKDRSLVVIEDAALALGSASADGPVGSLGDVAFFSTDHSKTIGTHLGGIAVTGNAAIGARLRAIQARTPFLPDAITRRILFTFLAEYLLFAAPLLWLGRSIHMVLIKAGLMFYFSDELRTRKPSAYPYPARLSSAQAGLGLRQLASFESNAKHRRSIVNWLEEKVKWNSGHGEELNRSVLLRYSFLVKDRAVFEARFRDRFDLGIWFTSVVQCRDDGLDEVCYRKGSCPAAECVTRHIVNFPTHQRIPLDVIRRAVDDSWDWLEGQIVRECPI